MPVSRSNVAIILIKLLRLIVLVWINGNNNSVECAIDVNLPELEYLAAHLSPSECRHLVAALHYKTFELPRSLEAVEKKLDHKATCLKLLIKWNESVGREETHEILSNRLRQLDRNELADWLSKTSFSLLAKDLEKSFDQPFNDEPTTELAPSVTMKLIDGPSNNDEHDLWFSIDAIIWILLISLVIITTSLILGVFIRLIRQTEKRKKNEDG